MIASVFLQSIIERLEDLIARVEVISKGMTDSNLNFKPGPTQWSAGQIFEHMMVGVDGYLPEMRSLVNTTNKSGSDLEVVHSWFGKFLIKASGPSSSAPVPKKMRPGEGPHSRSILERWHVAHQELANLAKRCYGMDMCAASFKNPFVPLFKMSLADAFEILTTHAERHVSQIETIHRSISKSTTTEPEKATTH